MIEADDICPECGDPLTVNGSTDGMGDPVHVFCDWCHKAEHPADMPEDWDGETGCHLSCEDTYDPQQSAAWRQEIATFLEGV